MPSPGPHSLQHVEAARYALLRRLTLALRHRMVMHLEPIGLAAQVMERRLREAQPDIARIGEDVGRLHGFARTAVDANLGVVSWLAPDAGAHAGLSAAVQECVALLRGHLGGRGFELRQADGSEDAVHSQAVRTMVPAVLFALTDAAAPPGELLLRADRLALHLQLRATGGDGHAHVQPPYRPIRWEDVEALAEAENVRLQRTASAVALQFAPA